MRPAVPLVPVLPDPRRKSMRAALVVALAVAAGLAGCVTPPADPAPEDPGADPDVLPWALTRCAYLVGTSPADPAKVQARLPEGFTLATGRFLGLAPMPLGSIGTEAFVCESGSGLDTTEPGMTYGSIWVSVIPPDEYVVEGIEEYYYKEAILVPDADRRALLEARGFPVHAGDASVQDGALPGSRDARLALDGFGAFSLALTAPQPRQGGAPEGGEFIELTPNAAGEILVWRSAFAWDEDDFRQGRGTITWPAGSWAADAVGSETAPGQFHAGTWSFQGNITLPS